MGVCETCGNRYEKSIQVQMNGIQHCYDCFECAIHALAPRCNNCGVRIMGHGVEVEDRVFCSAHCGRIQGENGFCDHAIGGTDTSQWSV